VKLLDLLYVLTLPVIAIDAIYLLYNFGMLYLAWANPSGGLDADLAGTVAHRGLVGVAIALAILVATFIARSMIANRMKKPA
jgi:hypothetical protein